MFRTSTDSQKVNWRWILRCLFLIGSAAGVTARADVEYSRDIQPVLAANCFSCHGSDEAHRKGGLRLDIPPATADSAGTEPAIVPGMPDLGSLMPRLNSADPEVRMPPPDSGKSLTPAQISLIRDWIAEGARYQQHWSFTAPQRPRVPEISHAWLRNSIDAFVLDRLQREGLAPSPPAEPATLLRRMALDLTGLPPHAAGAGILLDDLSASVSEATLRSAAERLLASPHFGEKWGRHWLDAARYADSDGFEKDKPRFVWFYRDWVVRALNNDMPYDQFLVEQLAGDLLPGSSQDQRVATGFLRNSMINEEGGVDPEQFRMEAMFDRIDAIGKAMLGLTIQCAQCHDHKYDPLSQVDYYRIFAFLNNSHEAQATVYTAEQQAQRASILSQIAGREDELRAAHPDWISRLETWRQEILRQNTAWDVVRPTLDTSGGQKHYLLDDGSILAQGYAPTKHTSEFRVETDLTQLTGFRLELLNDANLPHGGPGRSVDGLCALSEFQVNAAPRDNPEKLVPVRLVSATADVNPPERPLEPRYADKSSDTRVTGPVALALDGSNLTAWGIDLGGGRSNVPRNAVFVPESPLISNSGFRLTFRLVQMHGGWNSDDNQNNNLGRFRISVTSNAAPQADPVPVAVRPMLEKSVSAMTDAERARVFSFWRTTVAEFAAANDAIEDLWQLFPRGVTQLVMQERAQVRPTYLLTRGDFLRPADQVSPGVPGGFHPLPPGQSADRLTLARWIADRRSPTTARAAVNRIWQEYFGQGLVRTSEDLGTQGEYPSHPELLDWLAMELMDHDWSQKHIHRLIIDSATYRQSSRISPAALAGDPENRLLARGARFRVSGEVLRDVALAAGGLLNTEIGGPGVYPPAPEFLFQPPASYGPKTWNTDVGTNRFRRAIYTFRFRSVPYPVLQNFDTPRGDTACTRRGRSNTPLQALTTLNEEVFMDCGRALALLTVQSCPNSDSAAIDSMMLRTVARRATGEEQAALLEFLQRQRHVFISQETAAAWQLAAMDPAAPPALPEGVTASDLAAWTAVARVILNLDETITRE